MTVFTSTRTATTFTAGEHAPSAVEVHTGAQVVNQYGNIALQGLVIDPGDRMSQIELDTSVEPPVLRLENVFVTALFGDTDSNGKFVQSGHELNQTSQRVSGDYAGPGSELKLT